MFDCVQINNVHLNVWVVKMTLLLLLCVTLMFSSFIGLIRDS